MRDSFFRQGRSPCRIWCDTGIWNHSAISLEVRLSLITQRPAALKSCRDLRIGWIALFAVAIFVRLLGYFATFPRLLQSFGSDQAQLKGRHPSSIRRILGRRCSFRMLGAYLIHRYRFSPFHNQIHDCTFCTQNWLSYLSFFTELSGEIKSLFRKGCISGIWNGYFSNNRLWNTDF